MSGYVVDPEDVEQLVTLLRGVKGTGTVSDEGAEVSAPGIWVQTIGYTFNKLSGYTLNARLVLVVPDSSPRKARLELVALLNRVLTVVKPTGAVTARSVPLPGDEPAVLPGMAFPIDINCDSPEETP